MSIDIDVESIVNHALSSGFDDAVVTITRAHTRQVKLAMNRIENVFDRESFDTEIFLAYKKRVMFLYVEGRVDVKSAIEKARKRIEALEPNEDYNGIYDNDGNKNKNKEKDKGKDKDRDKDKNRNFRAGDVKEKEKEKDKEFDLVKEGQRALELSSGFNCSGVIEGFITDSETATSAGCIFTDANEFYRACIRLYSDVETSGQSVECSENLDIERCVNEARDFAEKARKPERAKAGTYEVLYAPLAFANLVDHVLSSSSIYAIESGISFLAGKEGREIAVNNFSLYDDATLPSVNRRTFDDEGVKTRRNAIIENGLLKGYLYNTTYAKKYGRESTGNAGIISPVPWCGDIKEGTESVDEIIEGMKKGIIITNTWYTRFQNYRTAEFSTMPRDCALLVENGEVKRSLKYLRVNDSLERALKSIRALSRERKHIYWWEVNVPVVTPWALVDGVKITTSA